MLITVTLPRGMRISRSIRLIVFAAWCQARIQWLDSAGRREELIIRRKHHEDETAYIYLLWRGARKARVKIDTDGGRR